MPAAARQAIGVPEVGGLFIATKDVARLVAWYRALGIPLSDDGLHVFGPGPGGVVFSIQPAKGELPGAPGDLREEPYGLQRLTLNLRVQDLGATLAALRRRGVAVAGPRDAGHGAFAWVKDPDGNFVELWQAGTPP